MFKKLLAGLVLLAGLSGAAMAQTAWGASSNPVSDAGITAITGTIDISYTVVTAFPNGGDGTSLALGDVFTVTITATNNSTIDADLLLTLGTNTLYTAAVGGGQQAPFADGVVGTLAGSSAEDIVLEFTLSSDPVVLVPNTTVAIDVTVATDAVGTL